MSPTTLTRPSSPAFPARLADVDARFAQMVDELTRRGFLIGGLSAAALGLAGCGATGTTAAGSDAAMRTVKTMHGPVDVPADPTRIVATGYAEVFALLDLGITPVGRPGWLPDFAAYTDKVADVPVINDSTSGRVVPEKVAALKPDLIVGDDWPGEEFIPYDTLRQIAPTALFALKPNVGNWAELAALTAETVNQSASMTALEKRYDERAAEIANTFSALFAATRWDVVDRNESQWDLYGPESATASVLIHAGVRLAAGADSKEAFTVYSTERFDVLQNTDLLFVASQDLEHLREQPGFAALPAVQEGRMVSSDLFFPASYGMALALLDDLERIAGGIATP